MIGIVYDGQCGFCVRALTRLRRMARRDVFRLHDANDGRAVLARFPMLAGADTGDAMFAITGSGEVFQGFFAFRRILWASPWLFPLLPLFYAPAPSSLAPGSTRGPRVAGEPRQLRPRLRGPGAAPRSVR